MLDLSFLGKKTEYIQTYSPHLIYPVPRSLGRDLIGLKSLPFHGGDYWTGFELSWLNAKGKPEISMAEFYFPHDNPSLIESKSFKLYLNSFNQTKFNSIVDVQKTLQKDLNEVFGQVQIRLIPPSLFSNLTLSELEGDCIDHLDVSTDTYEIDTSFLKVHPITVEETLVSHLLKSNCLATGQPDWGSVQIRYKGKAIDKEGLLKYIISFRNHSGFAEHCCERFFCDIQKACQPEKLTIYTRYTRRGGLDINPFRSNFEKPPLNIRQPRQ